MTDLYFAKSVKPDDGCDWTSVIIWRMNAIARARSRACFVPPPQPVRVCDVTPPQPRAVARKQQAVPLTAAGQLQKTHTGTVIYAGGEKRVQIRETATVWTAGPTENYDKLTGHRVGTRGHCRLLLESIRPIENSTRERHGGELSAQQLVALIQGKTLSYQGIMAAVKKQHPDVIITLEQIRKRLWGMQQSAFIDIERHDDMPVTYFTLNSVDPRFYPWSARNARG
ncbi:hypothetical protein F9C28_17580 [Shimwellia pseudoproteus]|uniref:hypothetical protein n=1 Tax=Shimwellia pseudoproteus TaxID=570012 RepID=UPI0018ECB529|nr:hypothetical protein [Shimwellia pseudoproteus]MBJ3816673.1 hypothetical protein [Shimwellia pseudoproteus]